MKNNKNFLGVEWEEKVLVGERDEMKEDKMHGKHLVKNGNRGNDAKIVRRGGGRVSRNVNYERWNQERWEGRDYSGSDKHIVEGEMNENGND